MNINWNYRHKMKNEKLEKKRVNAQAMTMSDK